MKRLILIRHSKSSWRHEGLADEFRPLNERGYSDALKIAVALKKEKVRPDKIFCSPSVRTYSTAYILAFSLRTGLDTIVLDDRLYDSGIEEHLKVIRSATDKIDDLILIGHNDTISKLVDYLSECEPILLSTSGYAIMRLKTDSWNIVGEGSFVLVGTSS